MDYPFWNTALPISKHRRYKACMWIARGANEYIMLVNTSAARKTVKKKAWMANPNRFLWARTCGTTPSD